MFDPSLQKKKATKKTAKAEKTQKEVLPTKPYKLIKDTGKLKVYVSDEDVNAVLSGLKTF